jgi:hypothetical protein
MDEPVSWQIEHSNTGPMKVEMTFLDPSADLIDLIQHALVWHVEIEILGHRFVPGDFNIHTEFADSYAGPVFLHREVKVVGILAS